METNDLVECANLYQTKSASYASVCQVMLMHSCNLWTLRDFHGKNKIVKTIFLVKKMN